MKKLVINTVIGMFAAVSLNAGDCVMVKDLNVQFNNASTVYSDSSEMKEIKEYAQFLSGAKYNYDLSTRRAEKVRAELVKLGVNPSKVKSMGFGETTPLYDNNTESGAAKNRRVIGEVFNSSIELSNYMNSAKKRISPIKFQEQ